MVLIVIMIIMIIIVSAKPLGHNSLNIEEINYPPNLQSLVEPNPDSVLDSFHSTTK